MYRSSKSLCSFAEDKAHILDRDRRNSKSTFTSRSTFWLLYFVLVRYLRAQFQYLNPLSSGLRQYIGAKLKQLQLLSFLRSCAPNFKLRT